MSLARIYTLLALFSFIAGCDPEFSQDDVNWELMRHYPAPSFYIHDGLFWERYDLFAEEPLGKKLCSFREKYRGYIVLRPRAPLGGPPPKLPIYLVMPDGGVWTIEDTPEIVQDKSTAIHLQIKGVDTITIVHSRIAPAVDHFNQNAGKWTKYGNLTRDGDEIRLTLAETGKTLIKNLPVWQPTAKHRPPDEPGINC